MHYTKIGDSYYPTFTMVLWYPRIAAKTGFVEENEVQQYCIENADENIYPYIYTLLYRSPIY